MKTLKLHPSVKQKVESSENEIKSLKTYNNTCWDLDKYLNEIKKISLVEKVGGSTNIIECWYFVFTIWFFFHFLRMSYQEECNFVPLSEVGKLIKKRADILCFGLSGFPLML